MTTTWTDADLRTIDDTAELTITARRADGTSLRPTPIWMVTADRRVLVRTWYRRDTGWWGHARRSGRAHVRASTVEAEVSVADVSDEEGLVGPVDEAYAAKHDAAGAGSMVTAEARQSTLELRPGT